MLNNIPVLSNYQYCIRATAPEGWMTEIVTVNFEVGDLEQQEGTCTDSVDYLAIYCGDGSYLTLLLSVQILYYPL